MLSFSEELRVESATGICCCCMRLKLILHTSTNLPRTTNQHAFAPDTNMKAKALVGGLVLVLHTTSPTPPPTGQLASENYHST